jgi:hypothetical protein
MPCPEVVMDFQYYLKTQRKNCGGSLNRKLFTLRSYSHYLRLQEVTDAEKLPFYDVLKVRHANPVQYILPHPAALC